MRTASQCVGGRGLVFLTRLSILLAILAGSPAEFCQAEEYRFHREEGGIGLIDVVVDSNGIGTSVRFDNTSDAAAIAVWGAFIDAEINGTSGVCNYNGQFFDQAIILTGEFTSGVLHTAAVENGAGSEPYRIFKVTGLRIGFPFSRLRYPKDFRDAERTVLETHFGFETLFPKGIKLDGKKLDLSRFRREPPTMLNDMPNSGPPDREQASAGPPATRSGSDSDSWQHPEPIAYDSLRAWHARGGLGKYHWPKEHKADLNGDGRDEVFLGLMGFGRGMVYALFTEQKGKWILLAADVEGSHHTFEPIPSKNKPWSDFRSLQPNGRGGLIETIYAWKGKQYTAKSTREISSKELYDDQEDTKAVPDSGTNRRSTTVQQSESNSAGGKP